MAGTIRRALTKRNRPDISAPMPYREGNAHAKFSSGSIRRGQISAPMELISATNMVAYNAPDLKTITSSSSFRSGTTDESDTSPTSTSSSSTSITTPEDAPVASEPRPAPGYFPKRSATVTSPTSASAASTPRSSTSSSNGDAPAVPKRALSHTKKSHQELARQRSISRMSPPPTSLNTAPSVRRSPDMFNPSNHPFGRELHKVNEVAEDYGGTALVLDEEEEILIKKGLKKYSVEDYLCEIEGLYGGVFDDHMGPLATGNWI
ncbi:hypothetical protein VTN49DRAFT_4527 [Thermomyces lanuginosus]|uniref:uncharacterized protein n=1 Tax=Thermomyces lanuginosus TaxID=5541 RepID=UPI00374363E3